MILNNLKSMMGAILLLAGLANVSAQEEGFISNQLTVPPSPQAAQLGVYGEFPVSLATGSANVSFPLINIQEGGIPISVSLSYQSYGLRVNQRPSWVGMGWTLQAGGVITRSTRGLPDEAIKGFYNKCTEIPN